MTAILLCVFLRADPQGFSQQEFKNPDSVFSPSFFWLWNMRLDPGRLIGEIDDMARHEARSLCIHPYPKAFLPGVAPSAMEPDYLTEGYFDVYGKVLDHAAANGIVSWLYDEGGWPSGGACGKIMAADPERFMPRHLAPGRKIETWLGEPEKAAPYPSLIEPGVTELFLKLTHEEYYRRFSRHFGKTIRFAFTDEPAFSNRWIGKWLPWCTDFEEEFRRRKGYELSPWLDELLAMSNRTDKVASVRIDYRDVLSQLYVERYLLPIRDWCRGHGILSGGHFGGEDEFLGSVKHGFGHMMRSLRALDVPGVDVIWRQLWPGKSGRVAPFPLYASSVANQNGSKYVLSESCAIYGEGMAPLEFKWLVDYQLVRGCNVFVFSAYDADPTGNRIGGGGPHFGPKDPQWDMMSKFFRRVARLSSLLSQGKAVKRTAVLFDIRDSWTLGEDMRTAERRHYEVAAKLQEMQCDFDFVDDDQLSRSAVTEAGGKVALQVGKMKYEAVVLPFSKWMLDSAKAKLAEFERRGGVVARHCDFSRLDRVCAVEGEGAKDIRAMKRTLAGQALYFFVNESLEPREVEIAIPETAALVRADEETGEFLPFAPEGGRFRWSAPAAGSLAVVAGASPTAAGERVFDGGEIELDGHWFTAARSRVRVGDGKLVVDDLSASAFAAGRLGDWRAAFGEEFSGRVAYRTRFVSPRRARGILDLGEVKNACEVSLNGRRVGIGYGAPYRFEVEVEEGENVLEVVVANSLVNALAPRHVRDYIYEAFPPRSYYERYAETFNRDGHGSGLYGPVSIRLERKDDDR